MHGPWIKLWRNVLNDEKVAFILRRYGHDCMTYWIGLLTKCEDGVLLMDEEVFADLCLIEAKRYEEIRGIFVKRGLTEIDESGHTVVINWDEYQVADSTERSRACRERKRQRESAASATSSQHNATSMQHPCNGPATTEVEGDGEVEGEEERARAREIPPPSSDRSSIPESDTSEPTPTTVSPSLAPDTQAPHFALAAAWYRRYAQETAILMTPSEKDNLRARDVLVRIGGDISLGLRAVGEYFDHWREYWFAVSKATQRVPENARKPDFSFAAFCARIAELASGMQGRAAGKPRTTEAFTTGMSQAEREEYECLSAEEEAATAAEFERLRQTSFGKGVLGSPKNLRRESA